MARGGVVGASQGAVTQTVIPLAARPVCPLFGAGRGSCVPVQRSCPQQGTDTGLQHQAVDVVASGKGENVVLGQIFIFGPCSREGL